MNTQHYFKNNFTEMNPMHDCFIAEILLQDKSLIVIYDNLNQDVFWTPSCKSRKLTIKYKFESFCYATFYNDNKIKSFDLMEEWDRFNKLKNKLVFISYKYSVDSFKDVTLNYCINGRSKYYNMDIYMDAEEITYLWE